MISVLASAAFLSKRAPAGPTALPLDRPWFFALGVAFIGVFYAYGGYQNTINFGADVHDARRNLPRAVFFGILIVLACYLTINAAYVKVLGVPGIAGAKLVAAETARLTLGEAGKLFISLAIALSAMGFLNVTLMQIPRVYYSMAEDRTLPAVFHKVNAKTQTQEFGLLFLGAIILISIFLLRKFENILNYVMFLDTITLAIVSSSVFFLRRKARRSGEAYTGYRVPLYPVLPALFILTMLAVAASVLATQTREALYGTIFFAAGLPIFLVMRRISRRPPDTGEDTSAR
jgi:APA family basic amino acid/polyamine antiporter